MATQIEIEIDENGPKIEIKGSKQYFAQVENHFYKGGIHTRQDLMDAQ